MIHLISYTIRNQSVESTLQKIKSKTVLLGMESVSKNFEDNMKIYFEMIHQKESQEPVIIDKSDEELEKESETPSIAPRPRTKIRLSRLYRRSSNVNEWEGKEQRELWNMGKSIGNNYVKIKELLKSKIGYQSHPPKRIIINLSKDDEINTHNFITPLATCKKFFETKSPMISNYTIASPKIVSRKKQTHTLVTFGKNIEQLL